MEDKNNAGSRVSSEKLQRAQVINIYNLKGYIEMFEQNFQTKMLENIVNLYVSLMCLTINVSILIL